MVIEKLAPIIMNTRKTISESDLKEFDNFDKLTDDHFIFSLGVGLQYEYSPPGILFSAPYIEMGRKLWTAFKHELYDLLCNSETKEPKEWLNDTVTGDIRNLATGIISAITAKYDVSIAIALPAAALVIKNGLLNYCSTPPKKVQESVEEILLKHKSGFKKFNIKTTTSEPTKKITVATKKTTVKAKKTVVKRRKK